jgi:hypothetical protein
LRPASAAHGTLEARARLLGNPRARRRLPLAGMPRFRSLVKFSLPFSVFFSVQLRTFPCVFSTVLFSTSFFMLRQVIFPMSWRRLRGECFVMHFVRDGVCFRRRVLVIVFLIVFPVGVLIAFVIRFVIRFVITVQRFLQLFEFGRLDIRFSHSFDSFGTLFGIGLRLFVLGLGKLLGERSYVFVGEACAIRSMRVRDLRLACFGFRQRRSSRSRRAGKSFAAPFRDRSFVLFGNCRGPAYIERSRQPRGNFFIRERPSRRRRDGSFLAERSMLGRRRRRTGRNTILEFGERLSRQDNGLEIGGRRFVRL